MERDNGFEPFLLRHARGSEPILCTPSSQHCVGYSGIKGQPKALYAATKIIDALNFKGHRNTVWVLLQSFVREYSNDNDPFLDTYLCRLREDQIRAAEE